MTALCSRWLGNRRLADASAYAVPIHCLQQASLGTAVAGRTGFEGVSCSQLTAYSVKLVPLYMFSILYEQLHGLTLESKWHVAITNLGCLLTSLH